MPRCWSSAPRKKLPPPVTTAIWTPASATAAISWATFCTTSGSTPTLPPPNTSPDSLSRTRLYPVNVELPDVWLVHRERLRSGATRRPTPDKNLSDDRAVAEASGGVVASQGRHDQDDQRDHDHRSDHGRHDLRHAVGAITDDLAGVGVDHHLPGLALVEVRRDPERHQQQLEHGLGVGHVH